jgi:hypothetical protein
VFSEKVEIRTLTHTRVRGPTRRLHCPTLPIDVLLGSHFSLPASCLMAYGPLGPFVPLVPGSETAVDRSSQLPDSNDRQFGAPNRLQHSASSGASVGHCAGCGMCIPDAHHPDLSFCCQPIRRVAAKKRSARRVVLSR